MVRPAVRHLQAARSGNPWRAEAERRALATNAQHQRGDMSFRVDRFFSDLSKRLVERKDELAALAVMASLEHWLQFEAAAMVATDRERYGVDGGTADLPDWLVAAERAKLDLWISEGSVATVVEFKVIHNNKNFWSKIREVRSDLGRKKKPKGYAGAVPERWCVALLTYAKYAEGQEGDYEELSYRRHQPTAKTFYEWFEGDLSSGDAWYGRTAKAIQVHRKTLVSLDGAPYIKKGQGSEVSLALVKKVGG